MISSKTYKELFEILGYMDKITVMKIPMDILQTIKNKKDNNYKTRVDKKDLFKRYSLLILGCFIVAFAFNVFFKQYGIVCFGVSGLSIVANKFGISNFWFILIALLSWNPSIKP